MQTEQRPSPLPPVPPPTGNFCLLLSSFPFILRVMRLFFLPVMAAPKPYTEPNLPRALFFMCRARNTCVLFALPSVFFFFAVYVTHYWRSLLTGCCKNMSAPTASYCSGKIGKIQSFVYAGRHLASQSERTCFSRCFHGVWLETLNVVLLDLCWMTIWMLCL